MDMVEMGFFRLRGYPPPPHRSVYAARSCAALHEIPIGTALDLGAAIDGALAVGGDRLASAVVDGSVLAGLCAESGNNIGQRDRQRLGDFLRAERQRHGDDAARRDDLHGLVALRLVVGFAHHALPSSASARMWLEMPDGLMPKTSAIFRHDMPFAAISRTCSRVIAICSARVMN